MIRVFVAEDQTMVLGALSALLSIEADFEVVGEARDGRQALDLALKTKPDVIVTDIEMPGMTGLDLAAELKRVGSRSRVVIRPAGLPAPGARGGRCRLSIKGCAFIETGRRHPPRRGGQPRCRP